MRSVLESKSGLVFALSFACLYAASVASSSAAGNPAPGFPHDTIVIHVKKGENGPKQCDGGHSLFIRHYGGVIPETTLTITMIDWVAVDNDQDGRLDEDPVNGIDDDVDGKLDEDGLEPGAETKAIDCDAWVADPILGEGDPGEVGTLSLQIRDTDPRPGVVSVQDWWIRLVGKPEQKFAFTTAAAQTEMNCTLVYDPTPSSPLSGDEVYDCDPVDTYIPLSFGINLAEGGCVKQVKLGGRNPDKSGGKTPFCDISDAFMVDVDSDGDGDVDYPDEFIFSVSCLDDLSTSIDESSLCPLSRLIWEIDPNNTTSDATAQIFVSHSASASVKSGRIVK